MPLGNPVAGTGYAAEFQSSALPWMTSSVAPNAGSPVRYVLPMVTRFVTIINTALSGSLSIGVTYLGVTMSQNKVIIPPGVQMTLEWRITNLFIQGEGGYNPAYSLACGLTTVPITAMPLLTGSAADGTSWPGVG
jgi:hypothetical protein